ncbi:MAG TPA: PEPxxWA-CTERM sorting domain-containing protein [Caulobacteraceae bacterium]|nr:PEPxxWA-CTERM sorting domain-containing protein [Caulobacteraceae bacterium]
MSSVTRNLAIAAILPLLAASSAASAAILDITGVNVQSYNTLNVNGSSAIASAIELTVQGDPKPLWVWCVDLDHIIYIANYNPPLVYKTGQVTTDSTGSQSGTGNSLTQKVSGEIQTLAEIGTGIANSASPDAVKLTAIQGAIWEVEYGFTPSQVVGTPQENSDIAGYVAYAGNHPASGFADAIYPVGPEGEGFGVTQGFATGGVPEPTTWAMLILGFAHLGVSLRRRAAALRLMPTRAKRKLSR